MTLSPLAKQFFFSLPLGVLSSLDFNRRKAGLRHRGNARVSGWWVWGRDGDRVTGSWLPGQKSGSPTGWGFGFRNAEGG
jgi:hypothetical protein